MDVDTEKDKAENAALRIRSGSVNIHNDRLASFLYDLMIFHLPVVVVEKLVRDAYPCVDYYNGWLANCAKDLADRLREPTEDADCPQNSST